MIKFCTNIRAAAILALLLFVPTLMMAQGTIRGLVTDQQSGDALPGVSIIIVDTQLGTSSNADGQYELSNVPAGTYVLEARYLGYTNLRRPVTVTANQSVTVNFQLISSAVELDGLVVTALGIARDQRSIGYSTQRVDGDNLTFSNEKNVVGTLAGKIAGVQVVGASGASMGGTQKIKIRGVNSISGGGEPLFVVDGTPISNANFAGASGADFGNLAQDINPEDIESIDVLKGPAASALYGIRGQYGVIMITTKKGSKGRDKFDVQLNSSMTFEQVTNIMPYQNLYGGGNRQTWLLDANGQPYVQTGVDESWGPRMDGTPVRQVFSYYPQDPTFGQLTPFVAHPDNIKDYFEVGQNFSQGFTVSGGGQSTNFRLSFNDTRIQGIEPNTFLNRNNVGLSAGADVSDKWRFSTNINYATNNGQRPSQGVEAGSRYMGQWFQRSMDMNRLKDYQYDDGSFLHWNLSSTRNAQGGVNSFKPLYFNNPYFIAYENPTKDSRDRVFGDVGVTYQAMPELVLSANIRTDMYIQNIEDRRAFGGTGTPFYSVGKYQNKEMNYEFLAQYKKNWNAFSINGSLGANLYTRDYSYVSQSTVGGLSAPGFYNIDASIDRPNTNSYQLDKQVNSIYGLVSVGYDDTYFVDLSLRNDKSSSLPEDDNSYWYPSISTSIVFSELIDWEPLEFGKLRASFAQAGSDLSPYQTTPVFGVGNTYGSVSTLFVPSNINNPLIKPSFANSAEIGLDLNLFGRLNVDFTVYQQKNKNQILPLDVSGTSGYGSATINAGLIQNTGFELSLNGTAVQAGNFSWDATINLGKNNNELVELYEGIDVYTHSSTRYSATSTYLNSYAGQSFGRIVGQGYQRDPATGKILLGTNNLPLYTAATMDFGSAVPDFTGGFINSFRYKNFDLSAAIDFQFGGKFFSRSNSLAARTGLHEMTAVTNENGKNVRDPLSEGGGVRVQGISAATGQEVDTYVDARAYFGLLGQRIAEEWVYDASYIKLREIRLGYTLSADLISRLPIEGARVSLIAKNPLMIWQEAPEGLDASELSMGSQSISWYEGGQLNTVRTIGLDININF